MKTILPLILSLVATYSPVQSPFPTEPVRIEQILPKRNLTIPELVEKTESSVVIIKNTTNPPAPTKDDFDASFPTSIFDLMGDTKPVVVTGSGFFISDDGQIITNYHVVEPHIAKGISTLEVSLMDGTLLPAKIIGYDREMDIALIKVDVTNHSFLTLGDSDSLKDGEGVVAIGEPFGMEYSVTAGVVSHKHRRAFWGIQYFVQSDAAINPGNSGGPLFNMKGEVVAVNTLTRNNANTFSLSVASSQIQQVLERLKKGEKISRGLLGIAVEVPKGPPSRWPATDGVVVLEVASNSPASRIEMHKRDVIIEIDGQKIKNADDLLMKVSSHKPGDIMTIKYRHDGDMFTMRVVLTSRDLILDLDDEDFEGKL